MDEVTEEVKKEEELSPPEALAIEKIMKQLPDEVTEEQRDKVKSSLKQYRGILHPPKRVHPSSTEAWRA